MVDLACDAALLPLAARMSRIMWTQASNLKSLGLELAGRGQ